MGKRREEIGNIYNKLTVLSELGMDKNKNRMVLCECKCGNRIKTRVSSLRNNSVKSCGSSGKFGCRSLKEILFSLIDTSSGSWIWIGTKSRDGYGLLQIKRKPKQVHRLIYENFVGPIPKGMLVLHKNDIPFDVTPSNLFLGTQQDNIKDKVSKNRQAKGSKHGFSKLNENDVIDIKKHLKEKILTQREIAKKFQISQTVINRINCNKLWTHVL